MKAICTAALLVLGVLLVGCAATSQCGDAKVTRTGPSVLDVFTFSLIMEGNLVALPPISLSKPGTTELHVGPLPAGEYVYQLYLTGGSLYGDSFHDKTPPEASHFFTHVAIRATDDSGRTLFQKDFRLGAISWNHNGSRMYAKLNLPDISGTTATNYRLYVTVDHPSTASKELLHIRGFAHD